MTRKSKRELERAVNEIGDEPLTWHELVELAEDVNRLRAARYRGEITPVQLEGRIDELLAGISPDDVTDYQELAEAADEPPRPDDPVRAVVFAMARYVDASPLATLPGESE